MDFNLSLISRRDSSVLKGILILLIILGHNSILMNNYGEGESSLIFKYLYHFHVYAFLMLPSLYNAPRLTFERTKKDFTRL